MSEIKKSRLKNYALRQTKNKLLILLCGIEIVASLIVIIMCFGNVSITYIDKDITARFLQPLTYTNSLTHRLIESFIVSVVISIYDIISMINVCLIERYTYYPSKCKRPVRYGFTRLSLKLTIVVVLSSAVQFIPIKELFTNSVLVYEYIRLIMLTRKLTGLLYKRSFDARHHKYQGATVVAIYNRMYREYKISSTLLLTALFFQLLAIQLSKVYVMALTLLSNPQWFHQVYNIPIHIDCIVEWNNWALRSADKVVNTITGVSIAIGFFLLAVPYLVVTCTYLYRTVVRRNAGYGKHSFPSSLIEKMIDRHNSAYTPYRYS